MRSSRGSWRSESLGITREDTCGFDGAEDRRVSQERRRPPQAADNHPALSSARRAAQSNSSYRQRINQARRRDENTKLVRCRGYNLIDERLIKEKSWLELGLRNNVMERRRAMDGRVKKRKAETQDFNNDRLSKKLSTLNLGSYSLLIRFFRDLG